MNVATTIWERSAWEQITMSAEGAAEGSLAREGQDEHAQETRRVP